MHWITHWRSLLSSARPWSRWSLATAKMSADPSSAWNASSALHHLIKKWRRLTIKLLATTLWCYTVASQSNIYLMSPRSITKWLLFLPQFKMQRMNRQQIMEYISITTDSWTMNYISGNYTKMSWQHVTHYHSNPMTLIQEKPPFNWLSNEIYTTPFTTIIIGIILQ